MKLSKQDQTRLQDQYRVRDVDDQVLIVEDYIRAQGKLREEIRQDILRAKGLVAVGANVDKMVTATLRLSKSQSEMLDFNRSHWLMLVGLQAARKLPDGAKLLHSTECSQRVLDSENELLSQLVMYDEELKETRFSIQELICVLMKVENMDEFAEKFGKTTGRTLSDDHDE